MCCIRPWYEISASIETETNATTASPAIMRFFHSVKMMEDWSTSAQWFWFRYCLCQSLDLRIPRMPYVPLSCQFLPKNVRINVCMWHIDWHQWVWPLPQYNNECLSTGNLWPNQMRSVTRMNWDYTLFDMKLPALYCWSVFVCIFCTITDRCDVCLEYCVWWLCLYWCYTILAITLCEQQ